MQNIFPAVFAYDQVLKVSFTPSAKSYRVVLQYFSALSIFNPDLLASLPVL